MCCDLSATAARKMEALRKEVQQEVKFAVRPPSCCGSSAERSGHLDHLTVVWYGQVFSAKLFGHARQLETDCAIVRNSVWLGRLFPPLNTPTTGTRFGGQTDPWLPPMWPRFRKLFVSLRDECSAVCVTTQLVFLMPKQLDCLKNTQSHSVTAPQVAKKHLLAHAPYHIVAPAHISQPIVVHFPHCSLIL